MKPWPEKLKHRSPDEEVNWYALGPGGPEDRWIVGILPALTNPAILTRLNRTLVVIDTRTTRSAGEEWEWTKSETRDNTGRAVALTVRRSPRRRPDPLELLARIEEYGNGRRNRS